MDLLEQMPNPSLPLRQPKRQFQRRRIKLPVSATASDWRPRIAEPTPRVRDLAEFLDAESPKPVKESCVSPSDADRSHTVDIQRDSMLSSSQVEEGAQMPEKYVSIVELLKNKKLFIDGKARSKSGFFRLLRTRFKLNPVSVYFPGENGGRPVLAITQKEADQVIEALTTTRVVSQN
jgi:hypothetical protein